MLVVTENQSGGLFELIIALYISREGPVLNLTDSNIRNKTVRFLFLSHILLSP